MVGIPGVVQGAYTAGKGIPTMVPGLHTQDSTYPPWYPGYIPRRVYSLPYAYQEGCIASPMHTRRGVHSFPVPYPGVYIASPYHTQGCTMPTILYLGVYYAC